MNEKLFFDDYLTIFTKIKFHFGYPNSQVHHWIYLIKRLILNTHMNLFGVMFFIKKVAKLVENQKFRYHCLNHWILYESSYSDFLIRWIFGKLEFWCLFQGFLMKNYKWLLSQNDKSENNLMMLYIISKNYTKRCLHIFQKSRLNSS